MTKPINAKALSSYLNETEASINSRGDTPEIAITSLPDLNKKIWGLHKGKLSVIGARTSMGKTSLAVQFMIDALDQGKSVLYMSFEMTYEELTERIFCHKYDIDNFALLSGKFTHYKQEWLAFKDYLSKSKLIMSDGMGKTWDEIDAFMDILTVKPDMIVLDYIQAISQSSKEGKGFIDEYIKNFLRICRTHHIVGIIVSQLNRQTEQGKDDKSPKLHNLKGSGFLEELADFVFLLDWVGRATNEPKYYINLAKNRMGRTGVIEVKYIPQHYKFRDKDEQLVDREKQQVIDSLNEGVN